MTFWWGLLGAVLFFGVGALLLAAVHRCLVPLSRGAAAALLLLPLAFTGRALLTGGVYGPVDLAYRAAPLRALRADYGIGLPATPILSDVDCGIVPWRQAVRWAFFQGEWPLWNPFMLCGDPLLASAQPAPFYPVSLLTLLVPLALGLTLAASLQYLIAASGTFAWLRALGCRESAALAGAAGFAFSGFVVFFIGFPVGAAVTLLPWILLAARRLVAAPGPRALPLLVAVLAAALLAGHPETALHLVVVGAAAALADLARQPPRRWPAVLGWGALAGAAALALAAIQLLPMLEALPQTVEWELRGSPAMRHAHSGGPWAATLGTLLVQIYPFAFGLSGVAEHAAIPPFLVAPAQAYAGSLLVAPALYGLWRSRPRRRWLFGGAAALGFLAGAKTPLVFPLLGSLPLLDRALNERLIFVAALAVPCLAAFGLDLAAERGELRRLGGLSLLVAAALVLGLGALWPWLRAGGLPADLLVERGALVVAPVVLAGGLLLLARLRPGPALGLVLLLLLAQRGLEMGGFYGTFPARAFYPPVRLLARLPDAQDIPYRVVGHQFALLPNIATLYGLEDARGYQAIHHRRLRQTYPLWSEQEGIWFNRVRDLRKPFLAFLNVRYALIDRRQPVPGGWKVVGAQRRTVLIERRHPIARVFVPARVRLGVSGGALLREMAAARHFGRRAWIEPPSAAGAGGSGEPREVANGPGRIAIRRRGTRYELRAEMAAPGWVVVSETAWKGWRATSGGREIPLGIANHAFLAFELPAGVHEVELFYRPRSFELGAALSAGTLLLLGAAAARRPVRGLLARARRSGAAGA